MKVEALKSWGHVKKGDVFEVDEGVALRWARKSRVRVLKDVKEPTPKPKGPSRTKPEKPERTKSIEPVGRGWYEVYIDGEPILKEDGEPKKFRKDDAEAL